MSEYKTLNNYLLFKEINSDSIGVNYRAGEIDEEQRKASKHVLLAQVYPFISQNPEMWKRVNILMQGINRSNILNLYSPEKIIKEENYAALVYPYLNAWTFEDILENSSQKDIPINFDLTFSIALAIADLIDNGSSIVVSGEKSFHGFLTPDNILIDLDGKIYLKNYGIFPYLGKHEDLFKEMVNKYGAWVAPEFLRKERLVPQSDIYHLGYIIFRILTGEYFSYSEGEDFEAKFANISFIQHLPSSDKDFITHLINFFKKTLNPDTTKRFANIKEFKDYIAHFFHIEELSSVTFNLAYFMNSLYMETVENEHKIKEEEIAYVIPAPEPESVEDSHLVEDILAGLDGQKKSPAKVLIPILALAVIAIAVVIYFYMDYQAKAEKEKLAMQQQMEQLREKQNLEQQKLQEQLKALEQKETETAEDKQQKDEEYQKLQEQMENLKKQQEEERKKAQEELELKKKQAEEQKVADDEAEKQRLADEAKKKQEAEEARKKAEEIKRQEAERNKVVPGQLVPLSECQQQPEKIKGSDPQFPAHVRRKYKGNEDILLRAVLKIDQAGNVASVRLIQADKFPEEITSTITRTLKKWTYKPAVKNNVKVTVWLPVQIKITF